jgi:predicted DNA-binding transcriptional regulator YafY
LTGFSGKVGDMRADRLVATLLLLQSRERVTAAEVAAELEVSERTARRDLEALSAAGIPVYPQPGRRGGWSLLGGARTDLSGLKADEVRALFTVAGPAAAATPELKAALRKLVRALPEPFRAGAETVAASVVVDPGGWGQTRRPWQPPMLTPLQEALALGESVLLEYADRQGNASRRTVHPLGLAMKGTVWYLVAGTDAGLRTFRVSRVKSCTRTGEPAERPAGFDLEATWKQIVANVDEMRTPYRVTALVDGDVVPILHWVFDRQLVDIGEERDGRVTVTIGGHRVEQIAGLLAGFGNSVEVTDPPEARDHLARLGHELVTTYQHSAADSAETF